MLEILSLVLTKDTDESGRNGTVQTHKCSSEAGDMRDMEGGTSKRGRQPASALGWFIIVAALARRALRGFGAIIARRPALIFDDRPARKVGKARDTRTESGTMALLFPVLARERYAIGSFSYDRTFDTNVLLDHTIPQPTLSLFLSSR